jgi:hypothetical protein
MTMTPYPIRPEEWDELAQVDLVREAWGLAPDARGDQLEVVACGARFDFRSGGPGYSGDLFILHDDAFGGPPAVFRRDLAGRLQLTCSDSFWCAEGLRPTAQ